MPALYQHDPFLFIQRLLWVDAVWTDGVWMAITIACEGWAMALIAVLFAYARVRRPGELFRAAAPALVALLVTGAVVQLLKQFAGTPRPLAVLDAGSVHVLLEPLRLNAFPSGHSASAATVAAWALHRWGRAAWPLLLLAFLGGLSRVMVGAHWTFDVLGGWTVGALIGVAASAAALRLSGGRPDRDGGTPTDSRATDP